MPEARRRGQLIEALEAYAAGQSDLGREFARRRQMHPTDSAAVVAVLRAEERGAALTPARLADQIGLTRGATSILLNRLEAAGHVIRRRGETDRRVVTLHSTSAIHDAAEEFFAPLRVRIDAALAGFDGEELERMTAAVRVLTEIVDSHRSDSGVDERE